MEQISYLPDAKNDRQVKTTPAPPNKPLPDSLLFSDSSEPSNN
jgi:hypothetical protein